MPQPRIAVLIPCYNAEKTVSKALTSLAANTEPHDIILVDDGSTIPLRDAINIQPNMTILRLEKNAGITGALNHGLKHILERGYDFVARLDADDAASPDRLSLQRTFMDEHLHIGLLGGWGEVISENEENLFYLNHPTDHDSIIKALYYNSCFLHPTLMIRTSVLRHAGFYDDHYPSAEDYELIRRIAQHNEVGNLPRYLIKYTLSSKGISQSKRQQQLASRLKVQWRYRNFLNSHFYAGILKTLALWFLPVSLLTSMKQKLGSYRKR